MVKLIVGKRGFGKTKILMEKVQSAAEVSKGNVVCIEWGDSLKFDLSYHIRLIDIQEYAISGPDALYGFISGLLAGNYDITEIFVDATFRILCGETCKDMDVMVAFIERLQALAKDNDVELALTISCDPSELPEHVRSLMA